ALRAAGALCGADMRGASLGSMLLELTPGRTVHAGVYAFDVGEARPGGSAGAAPLVLQTILLPLAL
ncbi:MAG: RNA 3'-phosphate cyclase, partial [Gammaproteobacteria bacterium]|nr:RNA 3'-phosphate cyclase [Gammaproteobacteria bacterium]